MNTCLQFYAIFSFLYGFDLNIWFNTFDDAFCSILTFIIAITLIMIPFYVLFLFHKKEKMQKVNTNIEEVLSGFDLRKNGIKCFILLDFVLKNIKSLIVVSMDGHVTF